MNSWLILILILHNVHCIPIGHISNVSLTLMTSSSLSTMNGTREECLCAMVSSSSISALNLFSNKTCQLFSTASITDTYFSWTTNSNSQFYFLRLPTAAAQQYISTTAALITSEETSTHLATSTTTAACFIVNPPLMATTVFGNSNGSSGNSLSQLKFPWGITVNTDDSMLITDTGNIRVLRVYANASTSAVVASAGLWLQARRALFDSRFLNLFVLDGDYCLMTRYYNGSLMDSIVFGSTCGTDLTLLGSSASFCMDSKGNFYIADNANHRIMFWPVNATSGILLAGVTNEPGNDTLHLYYPEDIILDEEHGLIYVADTFNDRIVRYSLNSSDGTVVAGGNGQGVERNQLNRPSGLYLSKNTSTLYIADTVNNRIVRWHLGDSEGVTIAGDCNGTAGVDAYHLNTPTTLTMDSNEKYLYVSDANNNRIQRFTPI